MAGPIETDESQLQRWLWRVAAARHDPGLLKLTGRERVEVLVGAAAAAVRDEITKDGAALAALAADLTVYRATGTLSRTAKAYLRRIDERVLVELDRG